MIRHRRHDRRRQPEPALYAADAAGPLFALIQPVLFVLLFR